MASKSMFFYDAPLTPNHEVWLDEETARHVLQVLRMRTGDKLQLTNGRGTLAEAFIATAEKKKCSVFVEYAITHTAPQPALHLGIAFTKNNSRNEWLLEKATELGVNSIIPLLAERSEKEHFRYDRFKNIITSALLQSQQFHLPLLTERLTLTNAIEQFAGTKQKLVAHCMPSLKRTPLHEAMKPGEDTVILIGPEGDFTEEEAGQCASAGYTAVSMGVNRLRTETAAMAACAYFNMMNNED
jgi:16S rRNA (uracil1498-N3)-methyltransferase